MLPCVLLEEWEEGPSTFGFATKSFVNIYLHSLAIFNSISTLSISQVLKVPHFKKFWYSDTPMFRCVDITMCISPPISNTTYSNVQNLWYFDIAMCRCDDMLTSDISMHRYVEPLKFQSPICQYSFIPKASNVWTPTNHIFRSKGPLLHFHISLESMFREISDGECIL